MRSSHVRQWTTVVTVTVIAAALPVVRRGGRIEDITLTYLVVHLWDDRRRRPSRQRARRAGLRDTADGKSREHTFHGPQAN